MNKGKKEDNKKISPLTIKQHNAITQARYDMSALEKNIFYLLLSKLNDQDTIKEKYIISLQELKNKLEIVNRKSTREEFEEATKKLVTIIYEIDKDGDFLQVRLIASAKHTRYNDMNDLVELEISPDIRPYLFHLKHNFTEFELDVAFALKSKYSQRIYELLSLYKNIGFMHTNVDDFKRQLKLIDPKTKEEKYKEWFTFSNQVLEVAKRELTEHTDLTFSYRLKKTGQKYTDIEFTILPNYKNSNTYQEGLFQESTK